MLRGGAVHGLEELGLCGAQTLRRDDAELYRLLEAEHRRQEETLTLVSAASLAPPSVLACEGSVASNVTTEGYPGARYHAGCATVDKIERLAVERACEAFGARFANVQPHSGSSANQAVYLAVLEPGNVLLGMDLAAGGHLTHGARASMSGRLYRSVGYGVDQRGWLDYEAMAAAARRHRPRLIVCGASAYPRQIDFARFREVADEVGAYLLADISHVAGLVAAGLHPSPIDHAHFTTSSTYKQLCGPRGGLILMGRDAAAASPDGRGTLSDLVQRTVFPTFQGTPHLGSVAAKAHALARVATSAYRGLARRIRANARVLAAELEGRGFRLVSGGTDTHHVLLDLRPREITGAAAETALEACGIVVNRNRVPGDRTSVRVTGGVRLGTNTVAVRGMGTAEMAECARLIAAVLGRRELRTSGELVLDPAFVAATRQEVRELCRRFPLPEYPSVAGSREKFAA